MFGNSISNLGSAVPDARRLEVGSGKAYTTLSSALAALSGVTWKSSAAITGTVAATSGSAAVAGTGTTFLSQVAINDYLLIGSNYEPVKSIESNTALTLWSGSRATASGVGATCYKLNPYEIRIYGGVALTTIPTLPIGLDLRITGAPYTSPTWNEAASRYITLPSGHCGRLSVSDMTLSGDSTYLGAVAAGGIATGRGIFEFKRLTANGVVIGSPLHGSALTLQDISATNMRFNGASDYALFTDITHTTTDPNDVFLYSNYVLTDIAHPLEFVRYDLNNHSVTTRGQDGGWEYNAIPVGKIVNFRNCDWFQTKTPAGIVDSATPCLIFTSNGTGSGTYNFYDCILDSSGGLPYEINNHHGANPASTINFIRTTRVDGISLPRIANT